jgi:transcription elongation GreA/GreB family factor
MTTTTDMTEDQVVLTREGRRLLEERLGHLNRQIIPELRAALVDREDDRPLHEYEWLVERSVRLERLLSVAVVAESQPRGTDAVVVLGRRSGDVVDVRSPGGRYRAQILAVEPTGMPLAAEVAA